MVAGGIMNDKEKLRHQLIMAKSLVKSNNKKIKKALDYINNFLDEREKTDKSSKYPLPILLSDITDIKEILETGKLPTLIKD